MANLILHISLICIKHDFGSRVFSAIAGPIPARRSYSIDVLIDHQENKYSPIGRYLGKRLAH